MFNFSVTRAYTFSSAVKLALWRYRQCAYPIKMSLRDGAIIELRGGDKSFPDRWISSEIFVHDQYVPPHPVELKNIRQIVDVGANVGYSIVYFLKLFPDARVTAFEPHPAHVRQIQRHVDLNNFQERVKLHAAAAGVSEGVITLSDAGPGSSIVSVQNGSSTLSVPIVDWYKYLPEGDIDLLKIDIEGGEFALMEDERFEDVIKRTRVLTLEWHATDQIPDARAWCEDKVRSLGMVVYNGEIQYDAVAGTFWAVHP